MVTRVIKLGGSLLELSDWAERLRRWLDAQAPAANLIVVGGGERVEALRREQTAVGLSDESAHVRALQLMDQNAADVARALAGAKLVRGWRPEMCLPSRSDLVLECGDWAERELVFERSWRTTSDSIAAEVASQLAAEELVLLKSCLPEQGISSVVDPRFETHALIGQLVRVVNLREWQFPETAWRKGLQPNEPTRR
ncbi:MAG: hypothetical protein ACKO0N_02820 [Planctomycetota bacterium]